MKLSIVVPVYNEKTNITDFHERLLLPAMNSLEHIRSYEVVYVNDGSSDGTLDALQNLAEHNHHISVVSLSRNFGKEIALTAGIAESSGDAVLTIDADGQQPPNLIQEFVDKYQAGADVVVGIRKHYQKHGIVAKLGSKLFYFLMKLLGSKTIPGSTDFRLISRDVRAEFLKLAESKRITRGLIDWLGFKQEFVYFTYENRLGDKPGYNFRKLFNLAINSFVSLSPRPLYLFGWIGFAITLLSGMLGLFVIIQQFIMGDPMGLKWTGATCLGIFTAFLVGLVLISQAIMALYISHIHTESLHRPLYIIDKKNSRNLEK
ncbi:MAG: glycosyltransferase family 2 protein [Candidatus Nomurabacteria bacterium]|jgi:dolichol-phosphate mannosyltransferase|nr:glycosyltransferase family 2 protein [Candidatus Nomurabacteria bacterium]